MFSIPNPLHPAIVHFPIVLLLIGAPVAVVSVFVSRWHLAWVAAALLGLGAVGCFFAVATGDSAEESAGKLSPTTETLVNAHQGWAERTQIFGAIAGVSAIGAAVLTTLLAWLKRRKVPIENRSGHPKASWAAVRAVALITRVLTAMVALTACFFVYETARRGGELVYSQGVGVRSAPAQTNGNTATNGD
jgi:uncharacterized membrane protein